MPLDPNTDIDEGGDQVTAPEDYAFEHPEAGLETTQPSQPSMPMRQTSPGVYTPQTSPPSGIPAGRRPAPKPKFDPSKEVFNPDAPVYDAGSDTPDTTQMQDRSWVKAFKDTGDTIWQSVLSTGQEGLGAATQAAKAVGADPAISKQLQDWSTTLGDHIAETFKGMSPRGQQIAAASLSRYMGGADTDAQGNHIPTPGEVGWLPYLAQNAASAIPVLGLAALGPEGVLGTAVAGVLFGTLSVGDAYNKIHDAIAEKPDAQLQAQSPAYAQLRAQGMSEQDAKERASTLTAAGMAMTFGTGAATGVGLGGRVFTAGRGALARAGIGAAEAGTAMGAQAGVENVLTQQAQGAPIDPEQLARDVASGTVGGIVMGAAGGAFHGRERAAREEEPPPAPETEGVDPAAGAALGVSLGDEPFGPPKPPLQIGYDAKTEPQPGQSTVNPVNVLNTAPGEGPTVPPPPPGGTTGGTEFRPPAAQAAIDTSKSQPTATVPEAAPPTGQPPTPGTPPTVSAAPRSAPLAEPQGPRPSDGMKVGELRDALATMPGQDPKAVKRMSRNDLAAAYDKMAPAQEGSSTPSPESTTVVDGTSSQGASPATGAGLRPEPEPVAGTAALPSEPVGSLPATEGAAAEKAPEPAPAPAPVPAPPLTKGEQLKADRAAKRAAAKSRMAGGEAAPKAEAHVAGEEQEGVVAQPPARAARTHAEALQDARDALEVAQREIVPVKGVKASEVARRAAQEMAARFENTKTEGDIHAALTRWGSDNANPMPLSTTRRAVVADRMLRLMTGKSLDEHRGETSMGREAAREAARQPEVFESESHAREALREEAHAREADRGTEPEHEPVSPTVEKTEGTEEELAPTTSKAREAERLLDKVLDGSMTPEEAHAEYGVANKTGRPRGEGRRTFPEFLAREADRAESPGERDRIIKKIEAAQRAEERDTGESANTKKARTETLSRELERVGPGYAERIREMARQILDPVGKAADDAAARKAQAAAKIAAKLGKRIEDALPPERADPVGIDPRSSRYVASVHDARVSQFLVDALRRGDRAIPPTNAHDLLRMIANSSMMKAEAHPLADIARRFLKLAERMPVHTMETARRMGYVSDAEIARAREGKLLGLLAMGDDRAGDRIILNPDFSRTEGGHVSTFLHEVSHHITFRYFRNLQENFRYGNHPDLQAMREIRNELRRLVDQASASGTLDTHERSSIVSALQNVDELHTRLMTDPILHGFAAAHTPSSEFVGNMRALGHTVDVGKSVWKSFVNIMRRVLGMGTPKSGSEATFLDHIMSPTTDIVERAAEFNKRASLPTDPELRQRAEPLYDSITSTLANARRDIFERADPPGWLDRAKRGILKVTNRDAMVDWNRDILPGLDAWRTADENIGAASSEFAQRHGDAIQDLTGRIAKADNKEALSTLMTDVGLADAKVGKGLASDANAHLTTPAQQAALADVQRRYNGLSAKDQKTYDDVRDLNNKMYAEERHAEATSLANGYLADATDAQRQAFIDATKSKRALDAFMKDPNNSKVADAFGPTEWGARRAFVQRLASLQNMGFVKGDYFGLRRFGNYVVRYGDRTDPANYGVEMFESYKKAQARRAELVAQGRGDVFQVARKDTAHLGDLTPQPALAEDLATDLRRRGVDEATVRHMTDITNEMMLRHATHSEAARARMRRKGVKGASTDQARVLTADFVSKQARIGYALHGLERTARLRDIYNQMKDLEGPTSPAPPGSAVRAANVYQSLVDRMTRPQDHDDLLRRIGRAANGFSFIQSLMSPSHMLTSTIETHTNSLSLMGARHGYFSTVAALSRGLRDASPAISGSARNTVKALGNRLKTTDWNLVHTIRDEMNSKPGADKALNNMVAAELMRTGLIDHTQLQDIRQEMNPAGVVGTGVDKAWNIFINSNAAMAHGVDALNKMAVAIAAARLEMKHNGGDRMAARDYAIQTVRRVMPNYTTGNRELIARHPIMSPLLQFKRYGMHMYALMANLTREGLNGPNKREAWQSLAGILTTHALMAGTLTLIADPLRYIGGAYDIATGQSKFHDYQTGVRRFYADTFGPEVGEVLSRGLPHLAGIDLHRRVGLANLLEIPEMSGFSKDGAGQVLLGLMTGATGENLQNLVAGLAKLTHGDWRGGMELAIPRVFRDAMKGADIATSGVRDSTGKVVLPPEEVGIGGGIAQALGFQPAAVSEFRERRNAVLQAREEATSAHTQLTNAWLAASPADRPAIMSQIREFNADPMHRGFQIKMDQLLRDAQARRKQTSMPFGLRMSPAQARTAAQAGAF